MQKVGVAVLGFMCCLIILANVLGHPLSNNIYDDYNKEMVVFDSVAGFFNKIAVFTQTVYKTFSDGQSITGTVLDAFNGDLDPEPYGLYHHQPVYWIYTACSHVATPAFADPDEIDAFFDEVYLKVAAFFDDKRYAAQFMDELAEKCYFLYDATGALFVTYNDNIKFEYVDHLHTRNFYEGLSSWILAAFGNDVENSGRPTYTVNGKRVGVFHVNNGDLLLNGVELAIHDSFYNGIDTYYNRSIGAIPFDRDVWQACVGNRPSSWHLVGGVRLS